MVTEQSDPSITDKPKIYPSWVGKECPRFIGYKVTKISSTAQLDQWNSIPHDVAVVKLAKRFRKQGYNVDIEAWYEYEFSGFTLAHRFDLIALKGNDVIVVEVKPKDRSYNKMQYMSAQLLANANFDLFKYFVYEYTTEQFVPKIAPNYEEVIEIIEHKLENALIDLPMAIPSRACDFCPYATCEEHPQHDCNLFSGPFEQGECVHE